MTDASEPENPAFDDPDPNGDDALQRRNAVLFGGAAVALLLVLGAVFLLVRDSGSPNVTSQDTLPGTTTAPPTSAGAPGTNTTTRRTGTTAAGAASTTSTTAPASSTTSSTRQTTTTRVSTSSSTATSSTTTNAKPTIAAFSAPGSVTAAQCGNRGNTEIVLSWDARNATSVSLTSDGAPYQSGLPAKGSVTVNYGCVEGQHTYVLTAVGSDGSAATETRTVSGPPKTGA